MKIAYSLIALLALIVGAASPTGACGTTCPSFDRYKRISCGEELARLSNFQNLLKGDPNAVGYIFVYGGHGDRPDEAKAHAGRIRDLLIHKLGTSADRLEVPDSGYREQHEVVLYACPRIPNVFLPTSTVAVAQVRFHTGKVRKSEYVWKCR